MNIDEITQEEHRVTGKKNPEREREIGIHDNTRERTMPRGPIILEGVVSEKVGRNELKGKVEAGIT